MVRFTNRDAEVLLAALVSMNVRSIRLVSTMQSTTKKQSVFPRSAWSTYPRERRTRLNV